MIGEGDRSSLSSFGSKAENGPSCVHVRWSRHGGTGERAYPMATRLQRKAAARAEAAPGSMRMSASASSHEAGRVQGEAGEHLIRAWPRPYRKAHPIRSMSLWFVPGMALLLALSLSPVRPAILAMTAIAATAATILFAIRAVHLAQGAPPTRR